jgi:hypothetical protein
VLLRNYSVIADVLGALLEQLKRKYVCKNLFHNALSGITSVTSSLIEERRCVQEKVNDLLLPQV